YTVNGVTRHTRAISLGAGRLATRSWHRCSGSFVASPGANQVNISIVSIHDVLDTSYADHTRHFSFNAPLPAVEPSSYSVSQIRRAYGINRIARFGSAPADGFG